MNNNIEVTLSLKMKMTTKEKRLSFTKNFLSLAVEFRIEHESMVEILTNRTKFSYIVIFFPSKFRTKQSLY